MIVADFLHFSQEIVDGLKTGIYYIRYSKEVAGNFRPVILDEKKQFVSFLH